MDTSENKDVSATLKPLTAAITPYAMALMSHDMHSAATTDALTTRSPLFRPFLLCASIELGLKGAYLAKGCTKQRKNEIKSWNHDLQNAVKNVERELEVTLLEESDKDILSKINNFYVGKGLEYFTLPMIASAMRAYKDLPELNDLIRVSEKIQAYIRDHKEYIEGSSSDPGNGGIMSFS